MECANVSQAEERRWSFEERLRQYPRLRERVELLLEVVENAAGDAVRADEAEQRVLEEIRQIGQEALTAWAERKQARVEAEYEQRRDVSRKTKKKLYWQTRVGTIEINEQLYRRTWDGQQVRPFSASAGVKCRSYSLGLQRAMTDFGADESFERASDKLKEHYGIEVAVSAIRSATLKHGGRMESERALESQLPEGGVPELIVQADGSLVPIVSFSEEKAASVADRRRCREVGWREARLSLARAAETVSGYYHATMASVQEVGAQLVDCVIKAGGGQGSHLHCLGDGAGWIVAQVQQHFGVQASYLVDFHHLSEYLAGAAQGLAPPHRLAWLHQQQQRLKENRVGEVVAALQTLPRGSLSDQGEEDSVTRCERYINNRLAYLDYQGALAARLPIGSGEIESGHRWIIQARLKLSGAWWTTENAEMMLALREVRANGQWQAYWETRRQAAA